MSRSRFVLCVLATPDPEAINRAAALRIPVVVATDAGWRDAVTLAVRRMISPDHVRAIEERLDRLPRRVLRLVLRDHTRYAICEELGISPRTLEKHLAKIYALVGEYSPDAIRAWAWR